MGRKPTGRRKHLLFFTAGIMFLLPGCTTFWTPGEKNLEKAHAKIDQLRRDADQCNQETRKLQQENERLRQDLERVRKDVEKARKIDMEIEEMRRNLGR